MPEPWQARMAVLLCEYDNAFDWPVDFPEAQVMAKAGRRFTKWPEWLRDYRHPDQAAIGALRRRPVEEAPND